MNFHTILIDSIFCFFAGSSNTYRLGSQKKLYAQIPGLSNSSPVAPLSLNPSQSNTFVASPPLLFSPPVAMSTDVSNNQQLPQSQVASSTISGISQYQSPTASELETPTVLPPSFNNLVTMFAEVENICYKL